MSVTAIENAPIEPAQQVPTAPPALESTIEWSDSLWAHARELLRHNELLYLVTQREIKVRYKQSALGALWAILQPFSLMVVFTVFFSWFARMQSDGIPYPLFLIRRCCPGRSSPRRFHSPFRA